MHAGSARKGRAMNLSSPERRLARGKEALERGILTRKKKKKKQNQNQPNKKPNHTVEEEVADPEGKKSKEVILKGADLKDSNWGFRVGSQDVKIYRSKGLSGGGDGQRWGRDIVRWYM